MRSHGNVLDQSGRSKGGVAVHSVNLLAWIGWCNDAAAEYVVVRRNTAAEGQKYMGTVPTRDVGVMLQHGVGGWCEGEFP